MKRRPKTGPSILDVPDLSFAITSSLDDSFEIDLDLDGRGRLSYVAIRTARDGALDSEWDDDREDEKHRDLLSETGHSVVDFMPGFSREED